MVQTEKAVLLKLFIFLCIYCFISTLVVERLMPMEIKSRHAFFSYYSQQKAEAAGIVGFFRKNFFFSDKRTFLVLVFRILLSSFLKDMVIAACSPSIFFSPISEKLISKIESSPLDKSWIPETERLRQINQSKISGIKTSGYETGVDEEGHTFIYNGGKATIQTTAHVAHEGAKYFVKICAQIKELVAQVLKKIVSMVVFSIRSTVCTFSSFFLLILYSLQLVMRVIKLIYSFAEWVLMYVCSCINDASLLTVEVINESSLTHGEDIYANLKKSVERLSTEPDVTKPAVTKLVKRSSVDSIDSLATTVSEKSNTEKPKTGFKLW